MEASISIEEQQASATPVGVPVASPLYRGSSGPVLSDPATAASPAAAPSPWKRAGAAVRASARFRGPRLARPASVHGGSPLSTRLPLRTGPQLACLSASMEGLPSVAAADGDGGEAAGHPRASYGAPAFLCRPPMAGTAAAAAAAVAAVAAAAAAAAEISERRSGGDPSEAAGAVGAEFSSVERKTALMQYADGIDSQTAMIRLSALPSDASHAE